ncbi:MAG: HlyC/CorC family transporter [Clostridia bacterium]|nr:HlyC/CorC family transporter [Clostridia bacterium]
MMEGAGPLIVALIVLIALSGLFSATETAYSCVSKIKLKGLINNGKKQAERALAFTEKFESLLTTVLIGNNIVNLSAAAVSGILFSMALNGSNVSSDLISTIVLTVAVLIFGEITPKLFAKSYPETMAMGLYPFAIFFYYVLYPLNFLFRGYQTLLAKIFKIKADDTITDEQLMTIVDEAEEDGTLKEDESDLIRSALEFDDLEVGDILIPRVSVEAVPVNADMDTIAEKFRDTGYSRLVVYNETIDNVLGFVHEKDFYQSYLDKKPSIKSIVQQVAYTAEHTRISKLLRDLQARRCQMSVVTDEYGGMLGIVTLEDILEELVGEIYDEHDEENVPMHENEDGSVIIEGFCEIDLFFNKLGFETETDSNTFGGWITEQFGEIPHTGRKITVNGYEFKILKANRKCVLQAIAVPVREAEEEENKG